MAIRKIRLYGDRVLRMQSEPVVACDGKAQEIVDSLIETVDDAGGLGLAAPQIGVLKRVIVVVEVGETGRRTHHILVNPEIVSACGEEINEEGCLSVPGIYAKVKRPQSIVVSALSRSGEKIRTEASGLMARALAHEIDHLDGILFVDRIGLVKRSLLQRKLNEIRKKAKEMSKSSR